MFRLTAVLAAVFACALAAPKVHLRAPRLHDGRIVGGEDAEIEEYNYTVQVQWYGYQICGGAIISSSYVLTAAHCTDGLEPNRIQRSCRHFLTGIGGVVIPVSVAYKNPNYDYRDFDYDICILELASALEFSASIGPIPLPASEQYIAAGTDSIVTGWGRLEEGGATPTQLQSVVVPIVSQEACQEAYNVFLITDRMICAGVEEGGKDACQGDSGGPLVADDVLVGLVSWGYGCARPNYPGVYTRVPALVNGYLK
uniref:Trypsinogen RdoT2 n=1 Tax=Rhyzopertha dominica TaxID=92692 RepID=Q9XYY0_RHYDO|nr:trypsinogen RdoT2 precursor [Rhyzopertha dominica]